MLSARLSLVKINTENYRREKAWGVGEGIQKGQGQLREVTGLSQGEQTCGVQDGRLPEWCWARNAWCRFVCRL